MFAAQGSYLVFALLFVIHFHCGMADLNFNVANGTCYYASGERAHERFIPCGNEVFGHKSCCESQDMCLSSRACFNGQYGVTYLAGCTDEYYNDPSCPDKGISQGLPWAGLVYCNGTSNEWVACEDSGETVGVPEACWCPSTSRTVAFTDSSTLRNIMSLPTALGESISWSDVSSFASESAVASSFLANLVTDSKNPTASRSTTGLYTSTQTSTLSGSPAETTSPVDSGREGLSTGAKVGVSIGVILGLAVIGLFIYLITTIAKMRRRKAESIGPPQTEHQAPADTEVTPSEMAMRSPAWSGHKSELPADVTTTLTPAPSYRPIRPTSEVEGSPVLKTHAKGNSSVSIPGQGATYYEMPG